MKENPLRLWAHLVSEHAVRMSPEAPLGEMEALHNSLEHRGPGTIHSHSPASRAYSLPKIGRVLLEVP